MPFKLGANLSKTDKRDVVYASIVPNAADLPPTYSLRSKQSPVYNQGQFGTCEAYTAKDMSEFLDIMANGNFTPRSARGIFILCKEYDGGTTLNPDEGTTTRSMLSVITGLSTPLEITLPDDESLEYPAFMSGLTQGMVEDGGKYREGGYAALSSVADIKTALMRGEPVSITIPVYADYLPMGSNGVIEQVSSELIGYHEISVVGWDDTKQALEIKNHWDVSWGLSGYAFLPYSYVRMEAYAVVPWISPTTKGAPVNLSYPVANPKVTQAFGADFKDSDGQWHYPKYGLAGHEGIDFHAPTGTPVYACDDGTIIFSGNDGAYGEEIRIQHPWGMSNYGHNSRLVFGSGKVKRGDLIAYSGGTGDAEAPHLHFGIKINGVSNPPYRDWVNAQPYMEIMSNAKLVEVTKADGSKEFGFYLPATNEPALIDKGLNLGYAVPTTKDNSGAQHVDWANVHPDITANES
jgi:murein DD-endopeptidase MepM/ murein hydrolase activator NlpD